MASRDPDPAPAETEDTSWRIGRLARSPIQIPLAGWRQVLTRVWRKIAEDRVSLVSAGVAFYSLLAVFPAIAGLIAVYGLISDPVQVEAQFAAFGSLLPVEVHTLLSEQMRAVTAASDHVLGLGLAGAILLSVWSATRGAKALMTALNIVYDEQERRGFVKFNLIAFAMTFLLLVLTVAVTALVVAVPIVLDFFGLGEHGQILVQGLRWLVLAGLALLSLSVIYRYGPSRRRARWRWVSWGSVVAVILWLAASALFSFYVSRFGTFNATYGSVGAVIVLLMWLYISALITLLGAELNAEMERQTGRDTTRGGEQPRGERGAWVADHLPGERGCRTPLGRAGEGKGEGTVGTDSAPPSPSAAGVLGGPWPGATKSNRSG
ncbi:putative membrane protein [Thioflavicoccus mobilis 8321]|uniref:Putative membrane protein n=1 Tax=Thioflavicoccus mobilis 8321 TaxID=765912 RepID=L0GY84_9GAMM|nr:YihY/virulence factor BrkB family protein [Thioflavicoccus mobilis]AGA90340.1 putative membrane protein [Thioflavicoccus mobilis 8321]